MKEDEKRQSEEGLSEEELQDILKPPSRRPGLIIFLIVIFLSAVAGGVYYYLEYGKEDIEIVTEVAEEEEMPSPGKPEQRGLRVLIESQPSGANVFCRGKKLGVTPLNATFQKNSGGYLYCLKEGYSVESMRMSSSALDRGTVKLKLERLKERRGIRDDQDWRMFRGNGNNAGSAQLTINGRLKQKWVKELGGGMLGAAAVMREKIIAGSRSNIISVFGAENGELIWQESGGTDASPLVDGKYVYIGANDTNLYAYQLEKGKKKGEVNFSSYLQASPVIQGEYLYQVSSDGALYAFTPKERVFGGIAFKERWKFDPEGTNLDCTPCVSEDFIAVNSRDTAFGLDGKEGKLLWSFKGKPVNVSQENLRIRRAEERFFSASCTADSDRIFFPAQSGVLYALERTSGTKIWEYEGRGKIHAVPVTAAGLVIAVWTSGDAAAIDAEDGRLVWKINVKSPIYSSPLMIGDEMIFGADNGNLYRMNIFSAVIVEKVDLGAPVRSSPSAAHDLLVVGTNDGSLHVFDIS